MRSFSTGNGDCLFSSLENQIWGSLSGAGSWFPSPFASLQGGAIFLAASHRLDRTPLCTGRCDSPDLSTTILIFAPDLVLYLFQLGFSPVDVTDKFRRMLCSACLREVSAEVSMREKQFRSVQLHAFFRFNHQFLLYCGMESNIWPLKSPRDVRKKERKKWKTLGEEQQFP